MKKTLMVIVLTASMLGVNVVSLPFAAVGPTPQVEQNIPREKTPNTNKRTTIPGIGLKSPNTNHPEAGKNQKPPADSSNQTQNPITDPDPKRPSANSGNSRMITDPQNILVLVNKIHYLSPNYVPPDLIQPGIPFSFNQDLPKKLMKEEAADALTKLFQRASAEGVTLLGVSGYRSYQTQKSIFEYKANLLGEAKANRISARPGQSEHQTGLAMDITSPSVNGLTTNFGSTPEGNWVARNAAEFGFIIRYQKGKEHITSYDYEPWHLRYVGVEVAQLITRNTITLEEYLEEPI